MQIPYSFFIGRNSSSKIIKTVCFLISISLFLLKILWPPDLKTDSIVKMQKAIQQLFCIDWIRIPILQVLKIQSKSNYYSIKHSFLILYLMI